MALLEYQLPSHFVAEQLRGLGGLYRALSLLSVEQLAASDPTRMAGRLATATYVGMAGAVTNATDYHDPTGGRRCMSGEDGFACSNGVLGPNQYVAAAAISDGLSNTMAIGEQSDWITDPNGSPVDLRSSNIHGAWIGAGSSGWPQNDTWIPAISGPDPRYLNCTTLRYSFGDKTDAGVGVQGMEAAAGTNMPVQSVHPGVVGVARCDGSVDFLSEAIGVDDTNCTWLSVTMAN